MDIKTLIKNHLSIDQNFILPLSKRYAFNNKEDFFNILKWWIKLSKSETIGNLKEMNNNFHLIYLKVGSSIYYINADTKRTGVEDFLKNEKELWKIILNENGVKNKVTNRNDEEAISGFYFYKEI